MHNYIELGRRIINEGEQNMDRTGIGTISLIGPQLEFNLLNGFPILTTKKVLFDTIVDELLWFIHSGHNVNDEDAPKRIWDDWADPETGDLGRIYGVQWRQWKTYEQSLFGATAAFLSFTAGPSFDQLAEMIRLAKKVPNSRRNIVCAWNAGEISQKLMSFPPCHVLFQIKVSPIKESVWYQGEEYKNTRCVDMVMYQRSADFCLGVPFNISSYALLLSMIANDCGYVPRRLVVDYGDIHIYNNHIEKFLTKQVDRPPHALPYLKLTPGVKVDDVKSSDISLEGYRHHKFIKYDVAV